MLGGCLPIKVRNRSCDPTYLLLDARGVIQARSSGGFSLGPLKEQVQELVAQIER